MFPDSTPLTRARFSEIVKASLEELGLPQEQFFGKNWAGGLQDHVGQVEQRSIPSVPQDTKGESSISDCSSISETYCTVIDDGITISILSHVYSYS